MHEQDIDDHGLSAAEELEELDETLCAECGGSGLTPAGEACSHCGGVGKSVTALDERRGLLT